MQQSATIGTCPGAAVTAANATTGGGGGGGGSGADGVVVTAGVGSNVAKPSSSSSASPCSPAASQPSTSSPSVPPPGPPPQQPVTPTAPASISPSSSSSLSSSPTPTSSTTPTPGMNQTPTCTVTSNGNGNGGGGGIGTNSNNNNPIPVMKNPAPASQQPTQTMVETMPPPPSQQHQQFRTTSHQQHPQHPQQQQHQHSQQQQHHQQQPPAVTTTAAQAVITVVASSTQSAGLPPPQPPPPPPPPQQQQPSPVTGFSQQPTSSKRNLDMISSQQQPVLIQVSSGTNHYITVASNNAIEDHTGVPVRPPPPLVHPSNTLKLEDSETTEGPPPPQQPQQPPHASYDDYNTVFSNGSNTAGQMAYYVSDSYPPSYYNPGQETYLLVDQQQPPPPPPPPSAAAAAVAAAAAAVGHDQMTIGNQNGLLSHRDQPNVMADEDYGKAYQSSARMPVQPQTIQWLTQNYETADGVSLPRSTLYTHYQQHCQQNQLEPVNAASFGKLIRSVFVGLRTRRLGTRGNSKYHYYGIRVRPGSVLNDSSNGSVETSTMPPVKRIKGHSMQNKNHHHHHHHPNQATVTSTNQASANNVNVNNNNPNTNNLNDIHSANATKETLQAYLGDVSDLWASLEMAWPANMPDNPDHLQKLLNIFVKNYRAHYERIIMALSELNFHEVEHIWMSFWQPNTGTNHSHQGPETLSVQCLKDLTKANGTAIAWIAQTDYTIYNSIISDLLLPNLLKPIPQVLTQQIRNFAKCINKWMANALQGYPEEFIRTKISAVSALSHMLRRYTSLNHLSTAACAVLRNPQQVTQMITDLNKVDFKNVQEQASWVCQCDEQAVHQVENSFKLFLQECNPCERWADWCEQVLNLSLSLPNVPDVHHSAAAKQFFFKWEFYSSLVMRDLTLRSAQSFGSFHLIRLLFDEYIFYLVEQRIAKNTKTTPLKMLGEVSQYRLRTN